MLIVLLPGRECSPVMVCSAKGEIVPEGSAVGQLSGQDQSRAFEDCVRKRKRWNENSSGNSVGLIFAAEGKYADAVPPHGAVAIEARGQFVEQFPGLGRFGGCF